MALRTLHRHFVALVAGLSMSAAAASAQNAGIDYNSDDTNTPAVGRNCPAIQDAAYVVDPVAPTPVFLPVTNAENATVSIFQYPTGGDVIFAGPSQLDYLFVPDNSFDGRATLRYRVTPKGRLQRRHVHRQRQPRRWSRRGGGRTARLSPPRLWHWRIARPDDGLSRSHAGLRRPATPTPPVEPVELTARQMNVACGRSNPAHRQVGPVFRPEN